jgi:hypothetical protein
MGYGAYIRGGYGKWDGSGAYRRDESRRQTSMHRVASDTTAITQHNLFPPPIFHITNG